MGYREMPYAMSVPDLSPVERLVLLSVVEHSNERHGWEMWWGQKRVADRLGISDRAVRGAYKVLEDRGFISRTPRHEKREDGYRRTTDTIRLNVDALKSACRLAEVSSCGQQGVADKNSASTGTQFRQTAEDSSALNKEVELGREQASKSQPTSPGLSTSFACLNEIDVDNGGEWIPPEDAAA